MTTRPLTDESGYTCDWGGCDDVAVVERYSPDHGWLPVCDRHKGPVAMLIHHLAKTTGGTA